MAVGGPDRVVPGEVRRVLRQPYGGVEIALGVVDDDVVDLRPARPGAVGEVVVAIVGRAVRQGGGALGVRRLQPLAVEAGRAVDPGVGGELRGGQGDRLVGGEGDPLPVGGDAALAAAQGLVDLPDEVVLRAEPRHRVPPGIQAVAAVVVGRQQRGPAADVGVRVAAQRVGRQPGQLGRRRDLARGRGRASPVRAVPRLGRPVAEVEHAVAAVGARLALVVVPAGQHVGHGLQQRLRRARRLGRLAEGGVACRRRQRRRAGDPRPGRGGGGQGGRRGGEQRRRRGYRDGDASMWSSQRCATPSRMPVGVIRQGQSHLCVPPYARAPRKSRRDRNFSPDRMSQMKILACRSRLRVLTAVSRRRASRRCPSRAC